MSRLYRLDITYTAYVVADDIHDAAGFVDEVVRTEEFPGVLTTEVRDALVYHDERHSLTLAEVWPGGAQ